MTAPLARVIATFGYVGHLRPASGTWGAAAAIPVAWVLHMAGGPLLLGAATLALFAAGLWASAGFMHATGTHDPSEIVVDEAVGQWIALWPISIGAAHAGAEVTALWPGILAAFLLFRAFDIWKPGPIGWADRQPGAMGVMLDDVLAGIAAAVCVMALAWVAHGLMGA